MDELILPIFAHRKNKDLPYLKRFDKEYFTIVTDACDSFSEQKMNLYFDKPTLAFLFVWYSKSTEGKEKARKKFEMQNKTEAQQYVDEMLSGIKQYGENALNFLYRNKK